MAVLKTGSGGSILLVHREQEVGRAARCAVRLEEPWVSAIHASLRWTPRRGWEAKDLGSRNRTVVDGRALTPGEWAALQEGSIIAFGDEQSEVVLVDTRPPCTLLVPLDEDMAEPIPIEHDTLALPSPEEPLATILRGEDGAWELETRDTSRSLRDGDVVEVAGRHYSFVMGQLHSTSSTLDYGHARRQLQSYQMTLRLSRKETCIDVELAAGGEVHHLPSRATHYLLLALARRKIADLADGLPEASSGWVYQDDLAVAFGKASSSVNVDVFRVRKELSALGIHGASQIIERRPRTGQMRLSLHSIAIEEES
jgi:hypothetical protein